MITAPSIAPALMLRRRGRRDCVRGHKVQTCDILNMHSSPLQYPLLQGRGVGVETGRRGGDPGGVMQDFVCELPRILIPRSRVNRGEEEG